MPAPLNKDTYFVAVKAMVRRGDELLITHDVFGQWDLPGGRLRPEDFETPLDEVLARKMREELGDEFRYALGDPRIFFRHERAEQGLDDRQVRIFAVGYEAEYVDGTIALGPHHDRYLWVDASSFPAGDYFEGGWLAGVREYQQLIRKDIENRA
ncbi:MAG TPA: NUDIX domain-containing protein [Solirubrobacteraceae bacterium]|nr:NUDIX domain-containing protein [Solirubrobacteraceae bacterium]